MNELTKDKLNNLRNNEYEIHMMEFIILIWSNKWTLALSTLAGVGIALLACIVKLEPPKWTATAYISRPSMFTLYQEIKLSERIIENREATINSDRSSVEERLYALMRNDLYNSFLGSMISKGALLKVAPGADKIYIASVTENTQSTAIEQLKNIIAAADTEAVNANISMLSKSEKIKAFNHIGSISASATTIDKRKIFSFLGGVLGLLSGVCIVLFKYMIHEKTRWVRQ